MSFTTRCPACGTMFRVVPDQLKISDGWVRCGHCSDVFDAKLNLQGEVASPPVAPNSGPVASTSTSTSTYPNVPPPVAPTPYGGSRVIVRRTPIPAPVVSAPAPLMAVPPPPPPSPPPVPAPTPAPPIDPGWSYVSQFGPDAEGVSSLHEMEAESAHKDNWDGEWLLSPNSISRHRQAVAEEIRASGVSAEPRVFEVSAEPSEDEESRRLASDDFQRELNRFRSSGLSELLGPTEAPHPGFGSDAKDTGSGLLAASGSLAPPPQAFSEPADGAPELGSMAGTKAGLAANTDAAVAEEEAADVPTPEPEFVLQARRDAFWRTPGVRAVLGALGIVLSGTLALQWLVHERDQLAARHPATLPLLQTVCERLGCKLSAPRRIDAVAIDSSTLVRKLGQFYSFDLVLKNSESMAVAMPALELSLTDARDNEIARRVFLPEEMPGHPTTVPASGSLSVSMRLSLSESDLGSMAGYRALVFYP